MSKKITRPLSILLSVIMVVSLFSIVPFTAGAAEATVLYELVYTLENGGEYLIVNSNTAGSGYALSNSIGRTSVTVVTQGSTAYINDSSNYSDSLWTAAELSTAGRFTLKNGSNYLQITGTNNTRTLGVTATAPDSSYYWSYSSSNHNLSYNVSGQISYVRYSSGLRTFMGNSSANNSYVYLYKKVSEESYNINATAGANGSISPSGETVVKAGEDQTFTVTPNSGYSVDTVTVDGKETILDTANTYTFKDVDDNHTIEVTFEKKTTEDRYYYKQVDKFTAGKQYILATATATESAPSGSGYAISTAVSNNRPDADAVTTAYGDFGEGNVAYISSVDAVSFDTVLWSATAKTNSDYVDLTDGTKYLKSSTNSANNNYLNATAGNNSDRYWRYDNDNHRLIWRRGRDFYTYLDPSNTPLTFRMSQNSTTSEHQNFYIYEKTLIPEFTVLFKNDDGTTLQNSKYYLGDTPEYTGAEPQKASTTEGVQYVFDGWDKEIVPVTGNTVYTATYNKQYLITWDKDNGEENVTDWVDETVVPSYSGEEPTKPADAQYSYIFDKWDPDATEATDPATYTAVYSTTVNEYTITWLKDDGITQIDQTSVAYGQNPTHANPTKQDTDQYTYTFTGWNNSQGTHYAAGATLPTVTGEETYTATFSATEKQYNITWKDGDGNTLKTEQVPYGENPVYTGDIPTKTGDIRKVYTFNGNWSPEITEVTGNAEYTAQFDEADKQLIHGVSLTLEGNITINFMIDPSAAGLTPEQVATSPKTITATFAWAENNNQKSVIAATKTVEVNADNYEEIGDLVPVSCDVCAAEMTCGINVSVELNGTPDNKTYCVRDYGKDVLDRSSNASKKIIADYTKEYDDDEQAGAAKYEKLRNLVIAMLDYGAKAQEVFDVKKDDKANNFFGEEKYDVHYTMQNVDDTMFETAIKKANGGETDGRVGDDISAVAGRHGAKWYTTSVYFLQFNKIRHVFTKANDTFNPSDYPDNQNNFYYYVESAEGIPAAELDKLQDFTVGNETFKYSVLDYARALSKSEKNSDAQKLLARAVYWYNQAANAFFPKP